MGDQSQFGFGNFVPGFDFLKNLTQGQAAAAPAAGVGSWVAPTLSVEEIDKRIQELKVVQFWLEQNGRALAATIQALEVQKMTLATLKGMNVSMGEMAKAFQFAPSPAAAQPAAASPQPPKAPEPVAPPAAADDAGDAATTPAGVVDPLQWWGALTQQFQTIATTAMQEASRHAKSAQPEVSPEAAPREPSPQQPQAQTAPAQPESAPEQPEPAKQSAMQAGAKAVADAASSMTAALAHQTAQHLQQVQAAAAKAMHAATSMRAAVPKASEPSGHSPAQPDTEAKAKKAVRAAPTAAKKAAPAAAKKSPVAPAKPRSPRPRSQS